MKLHTVNHIAKALHRTDLLYLPKDNEVEYCLVVVDCGLEHIFDGQSLREKTARAILVGINIICTRHVLEPPFDLTVDSGSEFKGEYKTGMADLSIH